MDEPRKPTLENFLAGIPLNEDMEQLALEVMEEETQARLAEEIAADPFDPLRPLDDADRKALLRMTQDPGWEVLQRIRKRYCAKAEREATLLSQVNPLANQRKIAEGWAYLTVMRQVLEAEGGIVAAELQTLKPKKGQAP